jgi:hypothetical protein
VIPPAAGRPNDTALPGYSVASRKPAGAGVWGAIMATVGQLAELSNAVYTGDVWGDWKLKQFRPAWRGWLAEGMQAGFYTSSPDHVVAFRGTNLSLLRPLAMIQDLTADLVLGAGANTAYYEAAETFVREKMGRGKALILCGHSLGGAIAQVLGKRLGLRFVTFNAPGVAVLDSPYKKEARRVPDAFRKAGMVVSALTYPSQTRKDIAAKGAVARGLNVMLRQDPVSNYGLHYGRKEVIESDVPAAYPWTQHYISTVISSLNKYPGLRDWSTERI